MENEQLNVQEFSEEQLNVAGGEGSWTDRVLVCRKCNKWSIRYSSKNFQTEIWARQQLRGHEESCTG